MNAPAEVCLVDDDSSVLRSMQFLLASDGIAARAFNKSAEFLVHAAANPVSVVVTDIWMEGVTGLEILARMCALSPRPRVTTFPPRCRSVRPWKSTGCSPRMSPLCTRLRC